MNRKIVTLSILTSVVALMILVPLASAKDINAGADQTIIVSQPPTNSTIIQSGVGTVRTPSSYTPNYYDVNWAITDNNIMYVWNDDGSHVSTMHDGVWFIIILLIIVIVVAFGMLIAMAVSG